MCLLQNDSFQQIDLPSFSVESSYCTLSEEGKEGDNGLEREREREGEGGGRVSNIHVFCVYITHNIIRDNMLERRKRNW